MNNKFSLSVVLFIILLCIILAGCPVKNKIGIPVRNAYYNEATTDVIYWGESQSIEKKIYVIGVDLDTSVLPQGVSDWNIDWKTISTAEGNEIVFSRDTSSSFGFPKSNFQLRLKNPYDPTNDANKRISFNTNHVWTIRCVAGSEFDTHNSDDVYIETSSKQVDFTYFKK